MQLKAEAREGLADLHYSTFITFQSFALRDTQENLNSIGDNLTTLMYLDKEMITF